MQDSTIYRPYSRLVKIQVMGRGLEVPENNILLRCFQYVAPAVPYGPFCWNGDCENDRICYRPAGSETTRSGLACQTLVQSGMEIVEISPDLMRVMISALQTTSEGSATAPAPEVSTEAVPEPSPAS